MNDMNKPIFKLSRVLIAGLACLPVSVLADDSSAVSSDVEQLRQQLGELTQRYDAQSATLQSLAQRLQQLENSGQGGARMVPPVRRSVVTDATESSKNSDDDNQPAQDSGEQVVKEAPASRSVEEVYRQQNALFDKTFTLETGLTYSHSDRRQLTLNGFLALDAIFLGNINLDRIKSDILQLDVTGIYGVSDRLQFSFNAPFLARSSTYESGGVGGSSSTLSDHTVDYSNIGDVSAGVFYRLFPETSTSPDVVLNVGLKAPTGKEPYGIKYRQDPSNSNLTSPDSLPTGNGVWTVSTGVTFVKTIDPAILFANVGYAYNFIRKFGDISGDPTQITPGEIKLGDSFQLGGGMAFALNDRMSLSMSYAHQFANESRMKQDGGQWQTIVGSDASYGSLNFGVTYAMSDKLSMVANVGMGVTPDAPDVIVGVKFPYRF
jgi:hypothetical protein